MLDTTTDLNNEKLTESMLASFADLSALTGADEMNVGVEGARQLTTTGKPTTAAKIAAAVGLPETRVEEILQFFADRGFAFRDDDGTVLAMWGVTAPGTAVPGSPHRVTIETRGAPIVYTWCALDTLYLSYMFDTPIRVRSTCPITERDISFTINPDGTVKDVTPTTAVLSVLIPDGPITKDVRSSFCRYVNFYADEEAGREWPDKQTVTVKLLGIAEAAAWTKQHYRKLFSLDKLDHETSAVEAVEKDNFTAVDRGVNMIRQYEEFKLLPVLVRLLAQGEPVSVERLASEGGWPEDEVRTGLARHPSVEWDDQGRIAGFGMTLRPTPHRFGFDGKTVYGWCASDALLFPVLLGRPGIVSSTCPVTGQTIKVEVTPEAVVRVDPPGAVVSLVRPTERVKDVRAEICGLGHFFSSREAASAWLAEYPDGFLHSVAEDFEVHRRVLAELGWTK